MIMDKITSNKDLYHKPSTVGNVKLKQTLSNATKAIQRLKDTTTTIIEQPPHPLTPLELYAEAHEGSILHEKFMLELRSANSDEKDGTWAHKQFKTSVAANIALKRQTGAIRSRRHSQAMRTF